MKRTLNPALVKSTREDKDENEWTRDWIRKGANRNGFSVEKNLSPIEISIGKEHWTKARRLIEEELKDSPGDHWLWTTLGLTYYEQRLYEKALGCCEKALHLAPRCPLALWDYAGALYMLGRYEEALAAWKKLLKRNVASLAHDECGEGMDRALQLVNDCHYRMGRCHQWLGRKAAAKKCLQKYLYNRAHGVGSIYDLEKAKQELSRL